MSTSSVDLAIIGAGAAGIAARAAGLSFLIVEAMGRFGGRAFTDLESIGLPWDQGCHWLHSASRNPLVPVADRLGLRYLRGEGHRRADIARPLEGRLFFAGEAASLGDFSTAHGAYQSGGEAVAAVRAAWDPSS